MDADFTESIKQWVAIDNQIKNTMNGLGNLDHKEVIFKTLFWNM